MKKSSLLLFFFVFTLISCGTESTPIYNLTTSVNGEGTISPSDGEFEEGETVTLTSEPNEGWLFHEWSGDGTGSSTSLSITMNSDKEVVGNFIKREYPLNITIEGEGTVKEEIIQSKSTEYEHGTVVELTPVPSDGWEFVEWGGDLSGSESPIQITVEEEKNVTVTFSPTVFLGENQITIMCPDGEVGDIGVVNGVEYEVVDRELLIQRIEEGRGSLDRRVCVSLITNMNGLFRDLNFNDSIEDWDVSNVTDMGSMFYESPFNRSIGRWNVTNVTNMSFMFFKSSFNQPIGNWDVSKVKSTVRMFDGSKFNQPLGNWNTSNLENITLMFRGTPFNQPIENWDVSNVTNMFGLFDRSQFNHFIGEWETDNVTDMRYMFRDTPFNQNISEWCVWRISVEPQGFSDNSPLTEENKPVWGTCPD